jgi:beta-lactamase class A
MTSTRHHRMLSVLVLISVFPLPLSGGEDRGGPTLEERLTPLIQAHKGKVAVALKNLETGKSWYYHADEPMPTASLIKFAVMIEAYAQADEGKLRLTDRVTLHDEDKVGGSGVLTPGFSDGATFSLRDAVRLMIVYSDNTATNLVLDKVGMAAVNKRMKAWGFPTTRVNGKVFHEMETTDDPEWTKRFDLGSTTAREMAGLFEELQVGERLRPELKLAMLEHLKNTKKRERFPRLLPPDAVFPHKGGSFEDARTEAAVLYTAAGPVVLCVLTCENEDQRPIPDNDANLLCARIAKAVYDHYSTPAPAGR